MVALFLWYWDRTRGDRNWTQWLILGAIAGLMMNVYYLNGVVLLVPLMESCAGYATAFASRRTDSVVRLFLAEFVVRGDGRRSFSANFDNQEDPLRQLLEHGLHGALVSEQSCSAQGLLFCGTRTF